jgi:3-oxoacyl-[acyl-carrier protein] reductase
MAKELTELHGVDMIRCDVSLESDVDNLFAYAEKRYGKISAVISCAGVALEQKPILDVTLEEIDRVVAINLKGALLVNKRAVLSMLGGGGKIINVSSVFGLEGGSCEVVYSATKTGVIGLTRALSEELSNSDISVCSVAFGLVDTPMNAHLSNNDKLEFVKEHGLSKIPSASDASEELLKILRFENVNGKTFKVFC